MPLFPNTLAKMGERIRAGSSVGGLNPSQPSIAPSIQYHPNTSALTMRADGTFQGYVIPVASNHNGYGDPISILVVTSWSASTCQALKYATVLSAPGLAAGTTIVSGDIIDGGGNGGLGKYYITGVNQTVGSSSSPVTFTATAYNAIGVADLKGRANLSSLDNNGPEVRTDAFGRKFLRFASSGSAFEWLRNLTITGLDTHNLGWFMVGRFPGAGHTLVSSSQSAIASIGANENGSVPSYGMGLGLANNFPATSTGGNAGGVQPQVPTATGKRMFIGAQMQVLGACTTTTDGLNASTSAACTPRLWLNETSYSPGSNSAYVRQNNVTGLTINAKPTSAGSTGGVAFDLYELNGYVLGELGTPAQSQARGDAIVASMMSNWAIPSIARSLVMLGDSRQEYGISSVLSSGGSEGNAITTAGLLADPGPNGLPADVRVISWAAAGLGVGAMSGYIDKGYDNFSSGPNPLATSWLLGGGKDYVGLLSGTNEPSLWPSTDGAALGGPNSVSVNAFVDDFYNGPGYTTTLTSTVSAGGQSITASNISPAYVYQGMVMSGTGWAPGASASAYATASPITLAYQQPTALSSVATTATLSTYQQVVAKLLSRGVKVTWFAEWQSVSSGYFNSKIINNAVADATTRANGAYAVNLTIADPSQITIGGRKPWTAAGFIKYGYYQLDAIHMTTAGKMLQVSGGDTPQFGWLSNIKALVAT